MCEYCLVLTSFIHWQAQFCLGFILALDWLWMFLVLVLNMIFSFGHLGNLRAGILSLGHYAPLWKISEPPNTYLRLRLPSFWTFLSCFTLGLFLTLLIFLYFFGFSIFQNFLNKLFFFFYFFDPFDFFILFWFLNFSKLS